MPIKNNAKKALRQAIKRTADNKVVKDAYKSAVKELMKAIETKTYTPELVIKAQKAIDKATKKGILKKNTASRKISLIMRRVGATK